MFGIKRFKNSYRWREYWIPKPDNDTSNNSNFSSEESKGVKIATSRYSIHAKKSKFSLNRGLKGSISKNTERGTPVLEDYLLQVDRKFHIEAFDNSKSRKTTAKGVWKNEYNNVEVQGKIH